jgi:murein DD-endopeptidase MepM/ murein hydrolase activator NlpD
MIAEMPMGHCTPCVTTLTRRLTRTAWLFAAAIGPLACRMGHAPATSPAPMYSAGRLPDGVSRDDYEYLRRRALIIPVANVPLARIPDTFNDARDGRRVHRAVDILAPRGTPVVSADRGRVLKMRMGGSGGITVYAVDPDERFIYYYAHLDRYRKGLAEGQRLQKGDTIGYVGTSGNAPRDTPHLHFQVTRMPQNQHWWEGVPVDPRPLFTVETTGR